MHQASEEEVLYVMQALANCNWSYRGAGGSLGRYMCTEPQAESLIT